MPFKEERPGVSTTIDTFNDIQRDQYNVVIYESHTDGTPQTSSLISDITLRYLHKYSLPPRPELMIGRDKEKAVIIDTLLRKSPARVAILGGGGMGKTTLALSILHEDAIAKEYPSRYFVSCEGVISISSLIGEIANTLRVPLAKRDAFLIDTIFSTFPDATLLCLDNFETLWDDDAMRPEIDEFLSSLQHRVLGLIITMRGAQRPLKVSWSKPLLPPLQPLTNDTSRRIFEEMTRDPIDEFAEKLLNAVDGIPLAISLISALLQEGFESSESLWRRWETQSGVLKHGSKHRLLNLDASIHLSVHGPRMQVDPTTIDVLAMLSSLPDGFPDDEQAIEELQHYLPEGYNFRNALLTLQHVSLVQVVHADGAAARRRLQILSPIQSYCQRTLEGSEDLTNSITSLYVQQLIRFPDVTDPDGHAIIPSELHNMRATLMRAWRRGKGNATVAVASINITSWLRYLGNPVDEVICAAMEWGVVGQPDLQGHCHRALGRVFLQQDKLDEAEASFKRAAELHRQAHDVIGEGGDLHLLGAVHLQQDRLDEAEASFKRAVELSLQAPDVVDKGNNFHLLGVVHLQRDRLDEAEASLKCAAELHQQARDVIREGADLSLLGEVHLRQDKLKEAEVSFKRAAELHQQARNLVGEGYDLGRLGGLQLQRDELEEAEASFKRAAELHRQAREVVGEGYDLGMLGQVYLRRNKVDEAEASFKRAAELHQQAHDVHSEQIDFQMLEQVYLRRSELDEAKVSLQRDAKASSVRGGTDDILESAQDTNESPSHRQSPSILGEADISDVEDMEGDNETSSQLRLTPAQNQESSQHKPEKLTFRKRLAKLFLSCYR